MLRLKDRQRQIPGGFRYRSVPIKFTSTPWASLESIAANLMRARLGNPAITEKNNWPTDRENILNELDHFNALVCKQMGWNDYITGGDGAQPLPFSNRPNRAHLPDVVAGAKVLVDWIKTGAEAVPIHQAEARAAICVKCPKNDKGDWTRFFTVPVSEAIRSELERKKGMNLATSVDDKLHTCSACSCPLKLKVHVPIEKILARISPEAKADLDPQCWITHGL